MNTLIISGGNIDTGLALGILENPFEHVIGVDGGVGFCQEHGIRPTRIVGDFDTLDGEILKWYQEHTDIEIRRFHPVKDATDTQIAVELALELGSTHITILGGTGTRIDHLLGNIQTMYLPFAKGVDCQMVDSHNRIRLIREKHVLSRAEQYGTYFSLLPYTSDVQGVTLKGAKYPLKQHPFTVYGTGSLGVSNEIAEDQVEITMENGILVLIESKD